MTKINHHHPSPPPPHHSPKHPASIPPSAKPHAHHGVAALHPHDTFSRGTAAKAKEYKAPTANKLTKSMELASQQLQTMRAMDEPGGVGKAMQSMIKNAGHGGNNAAFKKAAHTLNSDVEKEEKKSKRHGHDDDYHTANDLKQTLKDAETAHDKGQVLATVGGVDPSKAPSAWSTKANQVPITPGEDSNRTLAGLQRANDPQTFKDPGKGVISLNPSDPANQRTIKAFASKKDVRKFMDSDSKHPLASMQKDGWQMYRIKSANTTVLTNGKKFQTFDTNSGKKQKMPTFMNGKNPSGSMIFHDGTRLDVKAGNGLTFVSGSEFLTNQNPSTKKEKIAADPSARGSKYHTWTSYDPRVATAYVSTNAINPNHTGVQLAEKGKHEWAQTNNISHDGSQAWVYAGSHNQGTVGQPNLAWLNQPKSKVNPAITTALFSKTPQGKTVAPISEKQGWTDKQLGTANITEGAKVANFFKKAAVGLGVGLASVATIWAPGVSELIGGLGGAAEGATEGAAEGAAEGSVQGITKGSELAAEGATEGGAAGAAEGGEGAGSAVADAFSQARNAAGKLSGALDNTTGKSVQTGLVGASFGTGNAPGKAGVILSNVLGGIVSAPDLARWGTKGASDLDNAVNKAATGSAKDLPNSALTHIQSEKESLATTGALASSGNGLPQISHATLPAHDKISGQPPAVFIGSPLKVSEMESVLDAIARRLPPPKAHTA